VGGGSKEEEGGGEDLERGAKRGMVRRKMGRG
jgi:hypothetical protein